MAKNTANAAIDMVAALRPPVARKINTTATVVIVTICIGKMKLGNGTLLTDSRIARKIKIEDAPTSTAFNLCVDLLLLIDLQSPTIITKGSSKTAIMSFPNKTKAT